MSFIEKFLQDKALKHGIVIECIWHSEMNNLWYTHLVQEQKEGYKPLFKKESKAVHEDRDKSLLLAFLAFENPSYTFLPVDEPLSGAQ